MNTQKSNILIGKEAVKGILAGIKYATEAIRLSYGPKGCNAIIESEFYPFHQVANDAQTIVQAIEVTNQIEKRGLGLLKELMDKANKDSGDGRKTTAIIAEEILCLAVESKINPNKLKEDLDLLIPFIEKRINETKKEIDIDNIHKIATIAGESSEIGNILGAIYKKIGKDGIIQPEGSGTYETSYKIIDGVRFVDTGYLSPYLVHDEDAVKNGLKENKAIYENPIILVTKRKINVVNDIDPLLLVLQRMEEKSGEKKSLVIFTDDMDSGVASNLVKLHLSGKQNILIIKAPVIWKNYVFEDFAKITGSTIVEDASGINYKNLELKHLGTCGKIVVDKEETIITGTKDVSEHIAELKANGDDDSLRRICWLTTKTCILKIGANNESELSHKRLKVEDAINSSRLALKDGVVAGSGICLRDIAKEMPNTEAGKILAEAITGPYKQLCINNGGEMEVGENIIDPAKVIKNAVRNAISLASTANTGGQIVITKPQKTSEQVAEEMLKQKGLRF